MVQGAEKPSSVSDEVWALVEPYLLPDNHPIKKKLDILFSSGRITLNEKTMIKAKFTDSHARTNGVIVTRHKKVPGYVLKLYRDDQNGEYEDWNMCYRRCSGAKLTRETIDSLGYGNLLTVPKKWIYCLPDVPACPPGYNQKHFILVAEEILIYDKKKNYKKWKSSWMTQERLYALFITIKIAGLSDSLVPNNVPISKDGKIVFIDTEWYNIHPMHLDHTLQFLNPTAKLYWQSLIDQYGY